MTTHVKFASRSGTDLQGALATPPGLEKAPAVVVVQEWHGLNDYVRGTCDRFAQAGFIALAPDLFHGKVVTTSEEASQLMRALDKKAALSEVEAAVGFLAGHARSTSKVGVVGFCMGGALALSAARYATDVAAAVAFYGIPDVPLDELARIAVPVEAHFAKKDDWAKASEAEKIQRAITARGGRMELHVYDAGHAFMRSTDPTVYDEPSAKLAWERTIAFLRRTLG